MVGYRKTLYEDLQLFPSSKPERLGGWVSGKDGDRIETVVIVRHTFWLCVCIFMYVHVCM